MNPKIIDNPPKMWWSGDKRVEPYMPKINEALERNGLTGDAKTDCYNRAYEAVYKAIIDATAECARLRADLEWLVYWCLRADDPPISIGRGKELLGFTDMVQMRAWLADYSYRDNWGGDKRDV